MGVTIRHWFNTHHARQGNPHWTWAVTVVIFLLIAWLSTGGPETDSYEAAEARALSPAEARFTEVAEWAEAEAIVLGNCSMCHAREPVWEGIRWAPKGVHLETASDIARHAEQIYLQAGLSHAMPPPSASFLEAADRATLVAWYRAGRSAE